MVGAVSGALGCARVTGRLQFVPAAGTDTVTRSLGPCLQVSCHRALGLFCLSNATLTVLTGGLGVQRRGHCLPGALCAP